MPTVRNVVTKAATVVTRVAGPVGTAITVYKVGKWAYDRNQAVKNSDAPTYSGRLDNSYNPSAPARPDRPF